MPMTLEEKQQVTDDLSRRLEAAPTIYLTDFTGLDVQAMTVLRARLREEGVGYAVVKNTLALRALESIDFPEIEDHFSGPTGIVFGTEDPVIPARIVRDFAEEHEEKPTVKVGVVDRRVISADDVSQLAALPPRDELLASIMGSLTAPVSGIVGVLDGLMRDIAYMIEQVPQERESAGEE